MWERLPLRAFLDQESAALLHKPLICLSLCRGLAFVRRSVGIRSSLFLGCLLGRGLGRL